MKIRTGSSKVHPHHRLPGQEGLGKKKSYEIVIGSEIACQKNVMDAVHSLKTQFDRLFCVNRRHWSGGWSGLFTNPVLLILEDCWGCYDNGKIRINPKDQAEIPWTLAHELGHHVHKHFFGYRNQLDKKRVALWRSWALESKRFLILRKFTGHRENCMKYFTPCFSGKGLVIGCRLPNPSGRSFLSRTGRKRAINSKSGFDEFLAETFAIFENSRLRKRSKRQKFHAEFLRMFPKTLKRYWKMFHGSLFPGARLKHTRKY